MILASEDNDLRRRWLWWTTPLFRHPVSCDHFVQNRLELMMKCWYFVFADLLIHPHFVFLIWYCVFAHIISGILYLQRILALHIDLHDVALTKNTIWNGGSTARSYISLGTGWNGIHTNISPTAPIPRAQGITWKLKFVIMSFDLLGRARLILEEGKVIFLTLIEPFLILV